MNGVVKELLKRGVIDRLVRNEGNGVFVSGVRVHGYGLSQCYREYRVRVRLTAYGLSAFYNGKQARKLYYELPTT